MLRKIFVSVILSLATLAVSAQNFTTDAALKNEFFMTSPAAPGVLIKIPAQLRLLAASLPSTMQINS